MNQMKKYGGNYPKSRQERQGTILETAYSSHHRQFYYYSDKIV